MKTAAGHTTGKRFILFMNEREGCTKRSRNLQTAKTDLIELELHLLELCTQAALRDLELLGFAEDVALQLLLQVSNLLLLLSERGLELLAAVLFLVQPILQVAHLRLQRLWLGTPPGVFLRFP